MHPQSGDNTVIRFLQHGSLIVCIATLLFGVANSSSAEDAAPSLVRTSAPDWSQWRGPRRDGISEETGLLQSWPQDGPKLLWKVSGIGRGYSSPIVVEDTVFITGDKGDDLAIRSFSLDGSPGWQTKNGAAWKRSFPGARASCTYEDGKLYHMNAQGRLACLDAATGVESWAVNVLERFEAKNIMWGISESVVVHDGRVYATPAGAKGLMVALDKQTGDTVWASEPLAEESASYSSPILLAIGDRHLLVNGGSRYVFAVDAQSGELCWHLPQEDPKNAVNTTPILAGDGLFFTNASRGGGAVFGVKFDDQTAKKAWSKELTISHGGAVGIDDHLFGASSRGIAKGWVAIDTAQGTPRQLGELAGGSVIYADGRFYCLTTRGTMTLQELTADGFKTAGSFQLADEKDVWAHPVICRGRLFLRCHDTLYCYDIRH
jgi:outer membrane protein assembly factor BamB